MKHLRILLIFLFSLLLSALHAQEQKDPARFKEEVTVLTADDKSINKTNLILFTGSSSIRVWKDLQTCFPKKNVLNRGFGGSEMSDLVYYFDQLILPYQPKQIFIYEGDNDTNSGKSPEQILADADRILSRIRSEVSPTVEILFIAAKPSVARSSLKEQYLKFNSELKAWTEKQKNVKFIDVWTPMMDKTGNVQSDLFVDDNLHMNEKGYAIWKKVIASYIR